MSHRVDEAYLAELYGLGDRVVLITGGRHGIGRELALGFARAGATVVITTRATDGLDSIAPDLPETHAVLSLDVRFEVQVETAVAAVEERFGRLDVLVNNAGLALRKPALETTAEEWDAVMETNVRGTFLVSRAAVRLMSGGGRIVNLSSTFARAAHVDRAAYASSKAAIEQLTRALALEWAPRGITVNAIAPTTIETETRRDVFATPQERQARIDRIPLGRLGSATDVVGAALLLAGPAGAFITGQTLYVDGGFTLGTASG